MILQADVDFPREKCPCRQHDRLRYELHAGLCDNAADTIADSQQIIYRLLKDPEVRLGFDDVANRRAV